MMLEELLNLHQKPCLACCTLRWALLLIPKTVAGLAISSSPRRAASMGTTASTATTGIETTGLGSSGGTGAGCSASAGGFRGGLSSPPDSATVQPNVLCN